MNKTKSLLNFIIILLALTIPQAAFAYKDSASSADDPAFQKIDTKIGTGEEAEIGKTVNVHYTGWLYDEDAPNKKGPKFDSSHDRKEHFSFMLGAGRVIKGWDKGVQGMKVGGQRTLIIPPSMAYGSRGAGNIIPPDATLIFEVELIGLKSGAYH